MPNLAGAMPDSKGKLVIQALAAPQYAVRSSKRQEAECSASPPQLVHWDNCEQHFQECFAKNGSIRDVPASPQIAWRLPVPPVSEGMHSAPTQLVKFEGQRSRFMVSTSSQLNASTFKGPNPKSNPKNGAAIARNHEPGHNGTRLPPISSLPPSSSLQETAPSVITKTKTLLGAVSNYLHSSKTGKKRHGPHQKSTCCLCHADEGGDDADRTAIHTMEELKAFVHNDVTEMLRPVCSGISTLKTDLQNLRRPPPPPSSPQALQIVSSDVHIPMDGVFKIPASPVRPQDSAIPARQYPESASPDPRVRPIRGQNKVPGNRTGQEQCEAQFFWYSRAQAKKKDEEIVALRSTVQDLVDYQQKITVQLEKVQHLSREVLQRPVSSSDGRPTLYIDLLEATFKAALESLDWFTTYFVKYSEEKLHVPADKIWKPNFRNVYLSREDHWTFGLKAFFCQKLFVGFENESFMTDAASLCLDPLQLRKEAYAYFKRATSSANSTGLYVGTDAHFKTFCEQKFDSILPDVLLLEPGDYDVDDMENSFPTRAEILLSQSFTNAAMRVWTLHKLCFSFDPAVSIFRARQGIDVDWKYVESVVRLEDDAMFLPKVGFMIAPGFRFRDSTLKSQIYLASKPKHSNVGLHGHYRL